MDQLNLDQLRTLINSRNVLYASDKIDISNDVLAVLDARYRASVKQSLPAAGTGSDTQPK